MQQNDNTTGARKDCLMLAETRLGFFPLGFFWELDFGIWDFFARVIREIRG